MRPPRDYIRYRAVIRYGLAIRLRRYADMLSRWKRAVVTAHMMPAGNRSIRMRHEKEAMVTAVNITLCRFRFTYIKSILQQDIIRMHRYRAAHHAF